MSLRAHTLVLRLHFALATVMTVSLAAGGAWADEDKDKKKDDSAGDEEPPPPPPKKKPPPPPPPTPEKTDESKTDHERMVGHIGVSWFGVSSLPMGIGQPTGTTDAPSYTVGQSITLSAPALGIRWWINQTVGIDVGVGVTYSGGSVSDNNVSVPKLGAFGMLLHGGVPFSLATGKHISLQLTPETNIGFTHATVASTATMDPPPSATLSGVRFDLGARIGGEVHFGFIGIPELSLEGSIGAFLTYQATGVSVGPASHSDSNVGFTTASFNSPWDFFSSVVRARYYF
jgi:hypothetical protein